MSARMMPNSLAWGENFFDTPIIIQNFNKLSCLRELVDWLSLAGYGNIIILDNGSSYEPLLSYYSTLQSTAIEVVPLPRESTKLALWDNRVLDRFGVTGPFVYTDSDIIPDERCPADVVGHLATVLRDNPTVFKAGLGLRIDDLPETYKFRAEVVSWERRYWRRPVAPGLFWAPIDTTFALYRPSSSFELDAVRTGWPYLARHKSWYVDSQDPDEETSYYEATANRGHWGNSKLPTQLEQGIFDANSDSNPTLLHLGCGHERIPGWVNLDVSNDVGADITFDLEQCATHKLPLQVDSVDGFFMCHVFEHIDKTLAMMEELHRVAKPDARFIIRLPHGASDNAHENPTHRRAYFPNSFVYFAQPAYSRADYRYQGDWKIHRVKLVVRPDFEPESDFVTLRRISSERNVIREMIVELRAIKPIRARELQLLDWAQPIVSRSSFDEETAF
jgi:SAM-dependent methyltransferase